MKLKDARDFYYFFSGKTSDLVRQLGLAGIAIVWIFKYDSAGIPKIPLALLWPLVLIVVGLTCDLLQYAIATGIWGIFQRRREKNGTSEDEEFLAPPQFNWPGIAFFIFKTVAIVAAYIHLFLYLAQTIF
jgi:hypothetical protein